VTFFSHVESKGLISMSQCSNLVTPAELDRVRSLLRGTVEVTVLNTMLFSNANLAILQNAVRRGVYDRTGVIISPQSEETLLIILRGTYLEYGKNLPTEIPRQIGELNALAAKFAIDSACTQVKQYSGYIKDASSLPVPLSLPKPMGMTGTKQLPGNALF
jgi:hypothetical protein